MTTEASRYVIRVTELIAIRTPGHLHLGKDVGPEQPLSGVDGRGDERRIRTAPSLVEAREPRGNTGEGGVLVRVRHAEGGHELAADEGQLAAHRLRGDRAIDRLFGGRGHRVSRTAVAVEAVHLPQLACGPRGHSRGEILRGAPVWLGDPHVRNGLAFLIGRDVFDPDVAAGVPVIVVGEHHQRGRRLRIGFVVRVLARDACEVSHRERGPVTVRAGIRGNRQSTRRRGNGPRERSPEHEIELAGSVALRTDGARGAWADVAGHTRDTRVRSLLMRGEFRAHRHVARLAAEGRRFHVVGRAHGGERHDAEVDERQEQHDEQDQAGPGTGQIDGGPAPRGLAPAPAACGGGPLARTVTSAAIQMRHPQANHARRSSLRMCGLMSAASGCRTSNEPEEHLRSVMPLQIDADDGMTMADGSGTLSIQY